jgi:hypothetical protein
MMKTMRLLTLLALKIHKSRQQHLGRSVEANLDASAKLVEVFRKEM